jgi:transcription initiation factor TFIID subunit 13
MDPNTNTTSRSKKGKLFNDLEEMMYGFGDSWPPNADSVALLEQLVVDYIEDLTVKAQNIAELTGSLDKECFMYLIRKDRRKFNRVHQLLTTNEYIKKVKDEDIPQNL